MLYTEHRIALSVNVHKTKVCAKRMIIVDDPSFGKALKIEQASLNCSEHSAWDFENGGMEVISLENMNKAFLGSGGLNSKVLQCEVIGKLSLQRNTKMGKEIPLISGKMCSIKDINLVLVE